MAKDRPREKRIADIEKRIDWLTQKIEENKGPNHYHRQERGNLLWLLEREHRLQFIEGLLSQQGFDMNRIDRLMALQALKEAKAFLACAEAIPEKVQ